jgi:enoyl-CoA hydratase
MSPAGTAAEPRGATGTGDGAVTLTFDGDTATILIDRAEKLNALTPEMLDQFLILLAQVDVSDARVLVVRAAAAKVFCVGADINRFAGLSPTQMWREWTVRGHRVFAALAELRQPTVAVVHGHAFGGGLELALACDFRVLDDYARIGMPEVGLGTVPGWGGTELLTELVGRARAKEMIVAGRQIDAATAQAWGLATAISPTETLDVVVQQLVDRLLSSAPVAVQLAKQLVNAAADGVPSRLLEPLAAGVTATTADLAEGIAAFREHRDATFTGH